MSLRKYYVLFQQRDKSWARSEAKKYYQYTKAKEAAVKLAKEEKITVHILTVHSYAKYPEVKIEVKNA